MIGNSRDAKVLWRLLGYLRPYRWRVVLALGFLACVSCLELVGPFCSRLLIDCYLTPVRMPPWPLPASPHVYSAVSLIAWFYLAAFVVKYCIQYLQITMIQTVGQKFVLDLRAQLFAHLQRLPLSRYDRTPLGSFMTIVTSDVETLNDLCSSGVISVLGQFITVVAIVAALVRLDARLTLATFTVVPAVALTANCFRIAIRQSYQQVRQAVTALNATLQERIASVPLLQLLDREEIERARFAALNHEYTDANLRSTRLYASFFPVVEVLGSLVLAIIIWYGGARVLHRTLSLGTLVAFIQCCSRFYRPISEISEKWNTVQLAMVSAERVFDLLDEPLSPTTPAEPCSQTPAPIEFRNVWFSYGNNEEWVLRDVSFTLQPGECVAVVGHTGAGKTTLINLLLRHYDPNRGAILYNGVDIRQMDVQQLRRHFAVVDQEPFLFSGTVASNIHLGSPQITAAQVEEAARVVGADRFIESLEGGYQAPVHERGCTLSAGQRQLISFARALAHDADFLVLDEATSSVDTRTEQMLQEGMRHLLEGRSSLVVAHRLSTVRRADRILVMHHGRLVGQGTHEQLLAGGGIYSRLYELQYRDQEAVPVL